MTSKDTWASPFAPEDYRDFGDLIESILGAGGVVEESTLKWAFMVAPTLVGTATNPLLLDVIKLANDAATAAGPTDNTAAGVAMPESPTTLPIEPAINDKGLVPVGTSILCGGIGVVVNTGIIQLPAFDGAPSDPEATYAYAAAADDAVGGIQAAFDAGIIAIGDARTQKARLTGHETTTYGASRVGAWGPPVETAGTPAVAERVLYAGQVAAKDRGWAAINPVYFDGGGNGRAASQLRIGLAIPRSTNWPLRTSTRMRVEVMMRCLVGYQGSAGNIACDPALGTPVPPPTSGYQQIVGKRRW